MYHGVTGIAGTLTIFRINGSLLCSRGQICLDRVVPISARRDRLSWAGWSTSLHARIAGSGSRWSWTLR
jgi:hypothetical protein